MINIIAINKLIDLIKQNIIKFSLTCPVLFSHSISDRTDPTKKKTHIALIRCRARRDSLNSGAIYAHFSATFGQPKIGGFGPASVSASVSGVSGSKEAGFTQPRSHSLACSKLCQLRISVKRAPSRKDQLECDEIFARLAEFWRLLQSLVNDAEAMERTSHTPLAPFKRASLI